MTIVNFVTRRSAPMTPNTLPSGCPVCGRGARSVGGFCRQCGLPVETRQPVAPARLAARAPLSFDIAARSDCGRVRATNQDMVYTGELVLPTGESAYLCVVADGMGGAQAGELACHMAVAVTLAQIQARIGLQRPKDDEAWISIVREAIRTANRRVYEASSANPAHRGMGTTLVVALIVAERVYLASVGDSRAYRIDPVQMCATQLTTDHNIVARMVGAGQISLDESRSHPQRSTLYRAIGTDPVVEIDIQVVTLKPHDLLLLCSDGLIAHIDDQELTRSTLEQPDPDRACAQLVTLANARGGNDNISVVMVRMTR